MASDHVTQIRARGASGTLAEAGASWMESREGYAIAGWFVASAGTAGLALAWAMSGDSYAQRSGAGMGLLILSLVVIVAGSAFALLMRPKARSAVFNEDGTIELPHAFPDYPSLRLVDGDHRAVMGVESRPRGRAHGVVLVSNGGDTVWVSTNLPQERAFKVAVQLTVALTELRAAQAAGTRQAAAQRPMLF